jgi:hypothetical protein
MSAFHTTMSAVGVGLLLAGGILALTDTAAPAVHGDLHNAAVGESTDESVEQSLSQVLDAHLAASRRYAKP